METKYIYEIETLTTSSKAIDVDTPRASIRLVPDSNKGYELRKAIVTIRGKTIFDNYEKARQELAKVVLRHLGVKSLIVMVEGILPQKMVTDKGKEVDFSQETQKMSESLRRIMREDYDHPRPHSRLCVNTDSASPAIMCFYDALRREYPVDKYREMFKVIEYFSFIKTNGKGTSNKKHILKHLDDTWWIGETALQWAGSLFHNAITSIDLAERLVDYRGKCSHMKPDYGLKPGDSECLSEIVNAIPILGEVVRYTLERHPETRENP